MAGTPTRNITFRERCISVNPVRQCAFWLRPCQVCKHVLLQLLCWTSVGIVLVEFVYPNWIWCSAFVTCFICTSAFLLSFSFRIIRLPRWLSCMNLMLEWWLLPLRGHADVLTRIRRSSYSQMTRSQTFWDMVIACFQNNASSASRREALVHPRIGKNFASLTLTIHWIDSKKKYSSTALTRIR
jgi:hypothetical protein